MIIPPDPTLQADAETLQSILFRLSWASQRRLARDLESFGLTLPQYSALRAIQRCESGDCTMSELAEAAHQLSATMTGIVDRLVERGLVQRRRDPHDRRAQRVSLTEAGERLLAQADQRQRARLESVLESLSPAERGEMLRLMELYLENTLAEVDE